MNHTKTFALGLVCALARLVNPGTARASHFRHGTLSWGPTATPGEVEFRLVDAFRRGRFPGQGTAPDGLPQLGDVFDDWHTVFNFGDGTVTDVIRYRVIAFSVTEDWVIGEALDPVRGVAGIRHAYAGAGPFQAGINDCCRINPPLLNNRAAGPYLLSTTVQPLGGNRSPVSSLVPIVTVPRSSTASFLVPASDADDDRLRWRISTSAEAGGGTSPPSIGIQAGTGLVTWNNVGLDAVNFWTVQVIIEDLDANGVVKSQTPVDFLLKIDPNLVNTRPTCAISGVDAASPINVVPGTLFSFTVIGNDVDPGDRVTLNSSGLPAGAAMTPSLPVSGPTGVSSRFNWTPTAAQAGTYVIQYSATDAAGAQDFCPIIINVQTNVTLTKNSLIQGANVSRGEQFTYELSFDTFSTAIAAVGLRLVDPLPAAVDFVSMTTNGPPGVAASYDPASRTVTWDFGVWPPLTAGPTNYLTVRINANAVPRSTIVNQASVITSNLPPVTRLDRPDRCPTCPPGVTPSTNTCPVAGGQSLTARAGESLAIVLAGSDVDNDALTFTFGPAGHGTVSGTPPNVTYSADATYSGPDNFTYTVSDGRCSTEGSINITVLPANRCPVAGNQNLTVRAGDSLAILLTGSDADGDALNFTVGPASHGIVGGVAPNVIYTASATYSGADSFTYTVSDGRCSADGTIRITVLPNNQPPTAVIRTGQLVDLDPDFDHPVLISCNWWNACLMADGLLSSDPEGGSLSYLWFMGEETVPFASGPVVTNCLEVGEHTLTLMVTDPDGLSDSDQLALEVVTAPLTIELFIAQVNESGKAGIALSRKIKRELMATLRLALGHAGREQLREMQKALDAFEKKVRAQVAKDFPAAATAWIRWSQTVSEGMEKCLKPPRKPKPGDDSRK